MFDTRLTRPLSISGRGKSTPWVERRFTSRGKGIAIALPISFTDRLEVLNVLSDALETFLLNTGVTGLIWLYLTNEGLRRNASFLLVPDSSQRLLSESESWLSTKILVVSDSLGGSTKYVLISPRPLTLISPRLKYSQFFPFKSLEETSKA